MMTLPAALAAKLKSNDLRGIKPIILMYRNKWDAQTNAYAPETTPIDITAQVIKCGTLSTKLDVGEINEYTASNVTLTISDPQNHFVEGTPKSYFPDGYQIYGSRIELYAGTDTNNMTPLFYGVIRSLPNHKPEEYQLDISVVSALELLDDVEAKDFSTPYTGEKLTLDHRDDDAGPVYRTANTGVGGFNAVYANGSVLVEGVDYEVSQLGEYLKPALVEIINEAFYSATITADYYCWRRNLTVEEIMGGLLDVSKWPDDKRDIQPVIWNSLVRQPLSADVRFALGYYKNESGEYISNWLNVRDNAWANTTARDENTYTRRSIFSANWETEFTLRIDDLSGATAGFNGSYAVGSGTANRYYRINNGIVIAAIRVDNQAPRGLYVGVGRAVNANLSYSYRTAVYSPVSYLEIAVKIRKINNQITVFFGGKQVAQFNNANFDVDREVMYGSRNQRISNLGQVWRMLDSNGHAISPDLSTPSIISNVLELGDEGGYWGAVSATLEGEGGQYQNEVFISSDGQKFTSAGNFDIGSDIGRSENYLYFALKISSPPPASFNISNLIVFKYATGMVIDFINLEGQTVLEVIQDLALITGYEFGIDRNNVFFFRPRQTSTQPIATLDKFELVKIDTVTRNFNELATKLTLTFAAAPLEFYANTGARPTPADKYGIIEKEIDKPQLINYDNPELAQAIGPQLLAIYSELPNIITCTGKLNLALELGDIVNLKREMPLTINPEASDYTKYEGLNTFYLACKITGLNYDFTRRQVKYTLRDVSNDNNAPVKDYYEYQTIFPTPLDYKE